jgi:hypothetical protein
MELSGELMYGIGAVVILLALIWGTYQVRTRNRRNDRLTEKAVREEYDHPETYAQRSEELKRKVEPS